MKTGSLVVVGSGIKLAAHLSLEAQAAIKHAEKVFCVLHDALMEAWLRELNPATVSLKYLYGEGKLRHDTYKEMAAEIVTAVTQNQHVCVIFYGHPGVFAISTHLAIKQVRAAGYRATMLPAISAEDCLFADLGVDPGSQGCQSYEATQFLIYHRQPDITTNLILWQIGAIGITDRGGDPSAGVAVLAEELIKFYGADHVVTVYEAAVYAGIKPIIEPVTLADLTSADVIPMSTHYVPAKSAPKADREMMRRLGINT